MPTIADSVPAKPVGFQPRWRVGDEWDVNYRQEMDFAKKVAGPQAEFVDFVWRYRVEKISDSGQVEVSARISSPYDLGERDVLTFASTGQLTGVVSWNISDWRVFDEGPFFPIDPGWHVPVAYEWPSFPLDVETSPRTFDHGRTQQVRRNGKDWVVALGRRERLDGRDPDSRMRERSMEQVWEEGRPWWSTLRAHWIRDKDGHRSASIDIEGRVIEWRPAKE